ncbi:MAG: hypothetical protein KKE86_15170 [Planctomycetes bacterium]|nr:hypothetical protein [Planctomycetota bacterium]MBU4400659.1 hypothetical protein [Planctomycetota bacterium]MCG2682387.1 hypothetical protein [Planctomycetales bacterium]
MISRLHSLARLMFVLVAVALVLGGSGVAAVSAADGAGQGEYSYAIVAAKKTLQDSDWKKVVDTLQNKHSAKIFTYDKEIVGHEHQGLKGLQKALATMHPDFVCFVARIDELAQNAKVQAQGRTRDGRTVELQIPLCSVYYHEAGVLMRTLDDDPYDDARWTVLTGATPEDAMRVISAKPLTVSRGLSHVGAGWMDEMEAGASFSEGEQGRKWTKMPGKENKEVEGPKDTTEQYVKALNSNKVDMVSSSGHATEDDWQMGYSYKNGQIVIASLIKRMPEPVQKKYQELLADPRYGDVVSKLFGVDTSGNVHAITTNNPKIYYAVGNCLIGHVNGEDCMLLGWIHHGAVQFFGHVGVQTNSCYAWGIVEYFLSLQGRFTFAEAVWLNQQALYWEVSRMNDQEKQQKYICCRNFRPLQIGPRLLWETVVLYGDPVWEARLKPTREPLYDQKMDIKKLPNGSEEITFTVTMRREASPSRPAAFLLAPAKISDLKVKEGPENLVVADNFALVPFWKSGDPAPPVGKEFKAVVTVKRAPLRK